MRALHAGEAWDVAGPRPARGARRGTRDRTGEHHHRGGKPRVHRLYRYSEANGINVALFRAAISDVTSAADVAEPEHRAP